MNYLSLSKEQLQAKRDALRSVYDGYCERGLSLNMARGKPSPSQLDLSNAFLQAPASYRSKDGVDARNYSVPDDLPETAQLFASLLGIPTEYIIIGGNSSLNLMYDTLCRMLLFGTLGERPWIEEKNRKFLCPAPGYDRHFSVTQELGFELILVPMTQDGPDMDLVEALVAKDPAIKGIWCVPLYSNPQGVCYSDETVRRLAAMPTAAPDFRIMWDNAYGVHHLYEPVPLMDIFSACEQAGTLDRVFYFFSTSKISFPGGGVSMMAMSPQNRAEALRHISIQTIGPDKVNQLRLLSVLPTAQAVREHMERQAQVLRPRFELVLSALERALGGTGLASWTAPKGGYFVSLDTLPGCAKSTVELAKQAGVTLTGAGATFPYKKDPKDTNIRIAPTYPSQDELEIAIELLCVCVELAGVEPLLQEG